MWKSFSSFRSNTGLATNSSSSVSSKSVRAALVAFTESSRRKSARQGIYGPLARKPVRSRDSRCSGRLLIELANVPIDAAEPGHSFFSLAVSGNMREHLIVRPSRSRCLRSISAEVRSRVPRLRSGNRASCCSR